MYNRVFLVGNLARDPEVRYTPSGIPIAKFAIACNRNTKGEQTADFINIVAWRKLAEICGEYLKKGRPVAVEGKLQARGYKGKDGKDKTMYEVVIDNMQMLGKKPDDKEASPSKGAGTEEAPF